MTGDARLAQARSLLRAGDVEGAERACRAALDEDPDDAGAWHMLGFVELESNDPSAAAKAFEAAIGAGGDAPDLHLNHGVALLGEGRAADAVRAYERAVARAPRWVPALNGLGVALQACGRSEPAARAFERALAEDRDNLDVLINLGDAETARSDWAAAAACYERACALAPREGAAYRGLAAARERLGDGEGAVEAYERAVELDPTDVEALSALGAVLRDAGQLAGALECLRRAAALRPGDAELERSLRSVRSRQLPSWHWPMIADEGRNGAYLEAIERAVDQDSVVLDVGTGSGLLAMMAARAGARRVYACEASPVLAEIAREVVRANGLDERVTVIEAPSTALRVGQALAEPADVLVSEIVDVGLLAEGVLPTVRHAVRHLLTPEATVIPAAATVHARLVEIPRLRAVNPVRRIAGFDLSALDALRDPDAYLDLDLAQVPHRALSEDVEIARVDLARPHPPSEARRTVEIVPVRSGAVDAVAVWFVLHLDRHTRIETRPESPITAWGQAVHFQERDLDAAAGEPLRLEVRVSDTRVEVAVLP